MEPSRDLQIQAHTGDRKKKKTKFTVNVVGHLRKSQLSIRYKMVSWSDEAEAGSICISLMFTVHQNVHLHSDK